MHAYSFINLGEGWNNVGVDWFHYLRCCHGNTTMIFWLCLPNISPHPHLRHNTLHSKASGCTDNEIVIVPFVLCSKSNDPVSDGNTGTAVDQDVIHTTLVKGVANATSMSYMQLDAPWPQSQTISFLSPSPRLSLRSMGWHHTKSWI